jgi:hypothetical protein
MTEGFESGCKYREFPKQSWVDCAKAPEGWRNPGRFALFEGLWIKRQFLDCASLLAL